MKKFFTRGLFALLAALFLFNIMPGEARAAECGGLNQKSCWSINPAKWCKGDLKYVGNGKPGGGRCVRPKPKPISEPKCGGLNQKSCWNVNPARWCDDGLKYVGNGKPGGGRCVKPKPISKPDCGGLNQKSCWNVNPAKWCDDGLKYVGNGKPGGGRCVRPGTDVTPECGGLNQKSCWNVNPAKWCDGDLKYDGNGKPGGGRCVRPDTDTTPGCGGLDEKSCWNVNPARWCDGDLKYVGSGTPGGGRCIAPGEDRDPDCGGLDQRSCWSPNPANWCDGDLKYKPGIMPGEGRCVERITKEALQDSAKQIYERVKAIGELNPSTRLTKCLSDPDKRQRLTEAMQDKSANAVNLLISECGMTYQMFRDYGYAALGREAETLHITAGASASAGVGAESAIGYALQLRPHPDGRFYLTGGLGGGVGLNASADVSVGVSTEEMPLNHWATDGGKSVSYSGKALGGGGISIDFPNDGLEPSGVTISGGVGVGGEVGVVIYSADQYLYNF